MSGRPVFLTGLGAVSAAGRTCAETLVTFRSGARPPARPARFSSPVAKPVFEAPVPGGGPEDSRMRTFRLACLASGEALEESGLLERAAGLRVGVCLGTTVACQLNDMEFYGRLRSSGRGPRRALDRYFQGNLAAAIACHFGFQGPALTVANACSSGADALGVALAWLRLGLCDAALAGGADELSRVPMAGFHALGIMSDAPCAPFDRDRSGLTLGEGAGVLALEPAPRPGRPALVCAGYGSFGDAHHLTAPLAGGPCLEAAVRRALSEAGLSPRDAGFVNAHGTATPANDAVEGAVLDRVFGEGCPVSATKGYTGHTLGAAGGLEAVFTALALREGWIPASAGFRTRDPALPLAPVRERTPVASRWAVSLSLAFGGNNSALVLGRVS